MSHLDEQIRSVLDESHSRAGASRPVLMLVILMLLAIAVSLIAVRVLSRDELPPFRPIRNFADGSYVELVAIGSELLELDGETTWWTGDGALIEGFAPKTEHGLGSRAANERAASPLVVFALRPVTDHVSLDKMRSRAEPALTNRLTGTGGGLQFASATHQPGQKRITLKVALPGRSAPGVSGEDEAGPEYEWVTFSDLPLQPDRSAPTVSNPLETIRPIEIRPNSDTAVHDVDGRFVREEPERYLTAYPFYDVQERRPHRLCRLRLELPESVSELALLPSRVRESESERLVSGHAGGGVFDVDGRIQLIADLRVPAEFELETLPRSIDEVDLELRYLSGPMRPGPLTFKGPFVPGVDYSSTNEPGTLRIEEDPDSSSTTWVSINSPKPLDNTYVCLYTRKGKRILRSFTGSRGSNGVSIRNHYGDSDYPLNKVIAITVAEPPQVTRIRRIRIADCKPVVIDPDLIQLAEAFGVSVSGDLDSAFVNKVRNHRLDSVEQTIRALSALRETHYIHRARDYFLYTVRDPEKLTADQQQQILRICNRWQRAYSPVVRNSGIQLGLWLRPKEYLDAAISALERREPHSNWETFPELLQTEVRRRLLSDDQLEAIARLFGSSSHSRVSNSLFRCLDQRDRPRCVQILDRFAASDRPWLWWPAVRSLARLRWNDQEEWTEQFRDRELLARSSYSQEPEPVRSELWRQHAAELLTLELHRRNQPAWYDVLSNFDRFLEPEAATPVVISFLRDLHDDWGGNNIPGYSSSDWHAVDRCVRRLNDWHGLKLGSLPADTNEESESHKHQWRAIAKAAVDWYDNQHAQANSRN